MKPGGHADQNGGYIARAGYRPTCEPGTPASAVFEPATESTRGRYSAGMNGDEAALQDGMEALAGAFREL